MSLYSSNNNCLFDLIPDSLGWKPIKHLISLLLDYGQFNYVRVYENELSLIEKFKVFVHPSKRISYTNEKDAIIIIPTPYFNSYFLNFLKKENCFKTITVWIIDSFWTEKLSSLYSNKIFDHLLLNTEKDINFYKNNTGIDSTFIGWGSDVFKLGGFNPTRKYDILRIGRQPDFFNDEKQNNYYFEKENLVYCGRPPNNLPYSSLFSDYYRQSKYVLSHSNFSDNSQYTHPSREYITGRWTDALACGCIVLGKQPVTDDAYRKFLWPEAVIDIEIPHDNESFREIISTIPNWTIEIGYFNYINSLKRLDWRWRIKKVFDIMQIQSQKLDADLDQIQNIINQLTDY